MIAPGTTVGDAVRQVAKALEAAGTADSHLDARWLVEAAAGLSRELLVREPRRPLSEAEASRLSDMVRRRLTREPVTRILGERSFYGRTFEVTAATLDPRPETETLVELALSIADGEGWREKPIEILDIGTGSGCILVTLLVELPRARGLGTDISPAAIEVAQRNALRLGVADRVRWQVARSLEGVEGRFDLVVSNPPYIPAADIAGLDPEVARFDPVAALDGGRDGLDVVREIVAASGAGSGSLGTWLAIEIGAGQAPAVVALIEGACGPAVARQARLGLDLGGHTRCVAWKPRR